MNRALRVGMSPRPWTFLLLLRTGLSETFGQVLGEGKQFHFTPEATSLLITAVGLLTAILCRAEHTAGTCHLLSSEDQGYFRAEIMGHCDFLKSSDLSLGPRPGWGVGDHPGRPGQRGAFNTLAAYLQVEGGWDAPAELPWGWSGPSCAERRVLQEWLCTPGRWPGRRLLLDLNHRVANGRGSASRRNICRQDHVVWLPSLLRSRMCVWKM